MQDTKSKRVERGSGPRKFSPAEVAPGAAALEFTAPTVPATPIVAAETEAIAEPEPEIWSASVKEQTDSLEAPWAAFRDAQSVFARGLEEFAVEVNGMSRSGIEAMAEATGALLGAKSFSEAVEINATLARRETDVMIEGAAKLAAIGVRTISEFSQPILSLFGGRSPAPARG